ncbi:unnamed protein product [Choristocarpus tenellus]
MMGDLDHEDNKGTSVMDWEMVKVHEVCLSVEDDQGQRSRCKTARKKSTRSILAGVTTFVLMLHLVWVTHAKKLSVKWEENVTPGFASENPEFCADSPFGPHGCCALHRRPADTRIIFDPQCTAYPKLPGCLGDEINRANVAADCRFCQEDCRVAAVASGRENEKNDPNCYSCPTETRMCPHGVSRVAKAEGLDDERLCHMPDTYEVNVCFELELAFLHIYKAGGTSVNADLEAACKAIGGSAVKYKTWGNAMSALNIMPAEMVEHFPPPGMTLFTFVRDPLERFLSGYHEHQIRRMWKGEVAVPQENSVEYQENRLVHLENFLKTLTEVVHVNGWKDPHLRPQARFLYAGTRQELPVTVFRLENAEKTLSGLYSMSNLSRHRSSVNENRGRTRNETFGEPFFTVKSEELSSRDRSAICLLYVEDYCRFGFDLRLHCDLVQSEMLHMCKKAGHGMHFRRDFED